MHRGFGFPLKRGQRGYQLFNLAQIPLQRLLCWLRPCFWGALEAIFCGAS